MGHENGTKCEQSDTEKLRPNPDIEKNDEVTHKTVVIKNWQLTLEPALVGAMIAINLGQTSLQNFYLKTACTVDLQFPKNVCDSGVGEDFRIAEGASQAVVTGVNVSRSFVGALISTVVLLFLGPWSDCSGRRKPLLILPLLGMCMMTVIVLLLLTFPGFTTMQVLYAVQIPISLGGNFGLLLAAAFSYIGDMCHATGKDVTRVMGTHRAAIQVAHVVGAVSGPLIYRRFGFYGVFPIVLFLQVASLIYIICRVKDLNVNIDNKVSVFNWRLPLNAVKCLGRRREGKKRKIVFLMLLVALGDRTLLAAEVLLAFMYYRLKFSWDDVLFGSFLAYRNVISFLGTLLILTLLKRKFKLTDEVIGALSCASYVFGTSTLIATKSTIVVFLVPLIGIISQGSQVVQRPIINKQILPTEQGKIYSVMGALEQACQTITVPLYSLLYARTVKSATDAWLVPGIAVALIQLIAYVLSRRLKQLEIIQASKELQETKEANETTAMINKDKINVIDNENAVTNKV